MAELYDELYVALAEHLDAEEQRLLPIAARTVTQAEWERMGEAARAGTPKGKQFVVFGMIAYDGGPTASRS
jgi:hemerythrin-like domain-containing protein